MREMRERERERERERDEREAVYCYYYYYYYYYMTVIIDISLFSPFSADRYCLSFHGLLHLNSDAVELVAS